MIRLALRSALSDRAAENRVLVLDSWGWDTPSTKQAKAALAALEVTGRVLVVLRRTDEALWKSFRNLGEIQCIDVAELNAYDILVNDWLVFTTETLPRGDSAPGSYEADDTAADAVVDGEAEAEVLEVDDEAIGDDAEEVQP
jgi:large subunit ribosomal protein L4